MQHSHPTPTTPAAELFEVLAAVVDAAAHPREAYTLLGAVFQRCLETDAEAIGVRFGGQFAKTDYLLKEMHAAPRLRQAVNDARVRIRRAASLPTDELERNLLHDTKAVALFAALLCDAEVPATLAAHFPADRAARRYTLKTECLRVVVDRWDDTHIYARPDEAEADEVCIHYGGPSAAAAYKDWDWTYIGPMLEQGRMLNIVRPREVDAILYPELIIVEPDYLVDISAVAACFEQYAESPLLHLIGRIKPSRQTTHTMLGNMAGQLLDETLRLYPADKPYAESARLFFKQNVMTLLTTEPASDFHQQAREQKEHIRTALGQTLPTLLHNDGLTFDSAEAMVEPSFFSEMLGLQGRMDFLRLDFKVLIEQKAGKSGFAPTANQGLTYQKKHYVQLLLYMLVLRYNFRSIYEANNRELHAFLLYSRYADGLLPLGFAPDVVFDALKVRNGIAAADFDYSRHGLQQLASLNADDLNERHVAGKLWQSYQRPELQALLQPISDASALERAYYLRMLQFLTTEHLMAKVGSQTKAHSGFADKWQSSLADKLAAGNIYCGLRLIDPPQGSREPVQQLTLRFADGMQHEVSNFRNGDIVILYPYAPGTEPDARQTMVFRSTITAIGQTTIELSLRAPQSDSRVLWYGGEHLWAIEHDFFESSFNSLYRGMHTFLSAPQARRDLLMLQREPRTDATRRLRLDHGKFDDLARRAKQALDLFLIIGPPGTGKTSFGLMETLREELAEEDGAVLLLAYTNRAVDEICSKLADGGIDYMRIGGRLVCDAACLPHLIDEQAELCGSVASLRQKVEQTRVVVGTTSALGANVALFCIKHFSLAIVDEASQILEPYLVGLLSATTPDGHCAIGRVVMIGDHHQLPAVVMQSEADSAVADPSLRAIGLHDCRLSLFERLLERYRDNPNVVYMLTHQGRMHHEIADYPNRAFYNGQLCEVPLQHQTEPLPNVAPTTDGIDELLATRRVAFVDIKPTLAAAPDMVNSSEAIAIAATAAHIFTQVGADFDPAHTLGIIVPYRNQIAEIRNRLADTGLPRLDEVTIDTVERFQGSQRDYILYGFTVSSTYQLSFLASNTFVEGGTPIDRKLNVAMTRARKHLYLFGNAVLLAQQAVFADLIAYMRRRGSLLTIDAATFASGHFRLPSRQA